MKTKFIHSKTGEILYHEYAKNLPICDYHCHLSPKEIYEDKQFDNIGRIWLSGDHYKWRLMRSAGIEEKFITGDSSWADKFTCYIKALECSPGNPLYHWSQMELSMYFDCELELTLKNTDKIWNIANDSIKRNKISPRKLIEQSNVVMIGTTDDITDDLFYHELLNKDESFKTAIMPTFRTDNLMLSDKPDYATYIEKLGHMSNVKISDLTSLCNAVVSRLDYFVQRGCKISDVGIQYFPNPDFTYENAERSFKNALNKQPLNFDDYTDFLGYMFVFLSKEYKKRDITQQIHTGVYRNANTMMLNVTGPDSGYDISANALDAINTAKLLDKMNNGDNLAKTVLYILNPASYYQALTVCGSFRDVIFGAAWWHMDHYDGIKENIKKTAALSSLGSSLGMLTDSRSFLSYARHDYYRRILCDVLGEWVDCDEYTLFCAKKLVYDLCIGNVSKRFLNA